MNQGQQNQSRDKNIAEEIVIGRDMKK